MAIATGILAAAAIIGVGLSAGGAVLQYQGAKVASRASQRAEELRKRQMNLEATRTRRQAIREAAVARSVALSNSVAQGAGVGNSGLAGGYGQITDQMNSNILSTNQSQTIGGGIFDANASIARAQGTSALGGAFSEVGAQISNSLPMITRVGQYAGGSINRNTQVGRSV